MFEETTVIVNKCINLQVVEQNVIIIIIIFRYYTKGI